MIFQIFVRWSPGAARAFLISRAIFFAREKSGVLSMSCSWAFRMSWRMASHVLCVTWQKNLLPLIGRQEAFPSINRRQRGCGFDKGKPLFFQRFVYIPETCGGVTVYVNFRVRH